jgi:TRAP-type C4-dicarboxylate transport system substrate-binding protein
MKGVIAMKKGVLFITIISLFLIFVLPQPKTPAQPTTPGAEVTLRIASARPSTDVILKSIDWWAKEVEKRTNGAVKFKLFWAGSLVKATEELDAVKSGLIDFAPVTVGDYSSKLPLANLFYSIPFGPDQETVAKIVDVLYNEFPAMRHEIEQYNQKILYFLPTPSYDIGSMIALRTVADFKGKKIIVLGRNMSDLISALGAAAVSIPAPERYLALKTGVADGEVFPLLSMYDFKHGEVLKYITEVGLGSAVTWYFAINKDTWNKLSPDIQKTMETTAKEAAKVLVDNAKKAVGDARIGLKNAGVTVYTMSPEEKQKWANLLPDLPAQWANNIKAQGQPGWEIMTRFIALSKEYGHTFPREWAKK